MNNEKPIDIQVAIPCRITFDPQQGKLVLSKLHNLGKWDYHGQENELLACNFERAGKIIEDTPQKTEITLGTNEEYTAKKGEMSAIIVASIPDTKIENLSTVFGAPRGFVSPEDVKNYACGIYYNLPADGLNKTQLRNQYLHIQLGSDFDRACSDIKSILEERNARWDKFQDACKSKEAIHSLYDAFSPEGFCNTQTHDIPSKHLQLTMNYICSEGTPEQIICLQDFKQAYKAALGTLSPDMSNSEIAILSYNAMTRAIQDFDNNRAKNGATPELIAALNANNEKFVTQAAQTIESARIARIIKFAIEDDKANTKIPDVKSLLDSDKFKRAVEQAVSKTAGSNPQTAGDYSNIGEPDTSDNFDDVGDDR